MKYSMFIGRWQPWHKGHRWLIDQRLKENKNVLICIRDMETDKNNPYTPQEVKENVEKALNDLVVSQRVKVIIIPDIESVNYGRGVGYDIIEHVPLTLDLVSDNEEGLWAWEILWSGKEADKNNRYFPYTESGLRNMIQAGTFEYIASSKK